MSMITISLIYIPLIVTVLLFVLRGRLLTNVVRCVLSTITCIIMIIPVLYYYINNMIVLKETLINLPYIGPVTFWIIPNSAFIILTSGVVATAVSVFSLNYMEHRCEELHISTDLSTYYGLYLLYIQGLLGMLYSRNLIIMFIFLELAAITSFLLILFYGYGNRYRVALLYLVWSQIASLLVLCGILLLYNWSGTFIIEHVSSRYGSLVLISFSLILLGLLIKMGTFLVHFWLPWAHAEAPSPVSAILSPVHIGVAGYVLMEITHTFYASILRSISPYLMIYGIITMIYGGMMALSEKDIKRFLAYSSISHMGSMLICIAMCNYIGEAALVLIFVAHALAKSLLFMFSGFCITRLGFRDFENLFGLYDVYRPLAVAGIIGFISLSGVFNIGLLSKIYLTFTIADEISLIQYPWKITLISIYIISIMITIAYCFYAMKRLYFGTAPHLRRVRPVYSMDIPIILLALLTVILMFPQLVHLAISKIYLYNFIKISKA
ncbi:MAG: NADH dehydrogenase [Crenarchaeota archaeon]|nr:NADH dehydrogenase [Thermoproteota archaeon]